MGNNAVQVVGQTVASRQNCVGSNQGSTAFVMQGAKVGIAAFFGYLTIDDELSVMITIMCGCLGTADGALLVNEKGARRGKRG